MAAFMVHFIGSFSVRLINTDVHINISGNLKRELTREHHLKPLIELHIFLNKERNKKDYDDG